VRRTSRSARSSRSRTVRLECPRHHLEALEDRLLLAAMPLVTVPAQTSTLLGDTVNLNLVFTNAGNATGFGPYIDLLVPVKGADGKTSAPDDGIVAGSVKATYLGATLTPIVLTFDASGHATHPLAKDAAGAPLIVSAPPGYGPGDELIVLVLPFGSFTVGQPPATIQIAAQLSNLADVGTPLPIEARGGFEYGADPLDNPTADPTILQPSYSTGVIDPVLFTVTKTYIGPENETATGPDYVRQYEIDVSVAKGQVINNFVIQDALAGNIQFAGLISATANTGAVTGSPLPSTTTPGGTLTETFSKITGTGGPTDAKLVFDFYVPRDPNHLDGTTTPDLPTGGFTPTTNAATASGRWTPLDPRDAATNVSATSSSVLVTEKSIAIQKGVTDVQGNAANAVEVGDHLQYSLNFQVSDFFAFTDLVATDLFSDGQHFDAAFSPQLTFTRNGVTRTITIPPDAFVLSPQSAADGSDLLTFDISKALTENGYSPDLLGGSIPNGGTGGAIPNAMPSLGPTTGVITFRTVVQQRYDVQQSNTATQFLKQGDILGDKTTITGHVLDYADLTDTGTTRTDDSAATVSLASGQLTKTVYAINGVLYNGVGPALIAPDDDVTYRLTFTLPHTNFDNLNIQDFLPLPIFLAGQLHGSTVGTYTGNPPAAGTATYGPSDSSRAITGFTPTLTDSGTANSLTFDFGSYHDAQQRPSTIDLLLTVTATGTPFADGLFLTNQAHEFEQSVDDSGVVGQVVNNSAVADTIVQVQLTEPILNVTKGVVSTSDAAGTLSAPAGPAGVAFGNPGSNTAFTGTIGSAGLASRPIDSNLSNVQAGDKVRFAVTVENTGSGLYGAFDVTIEDTLPAGFDPASLSHLQVHDGAGNALAFTVLPGGLFGGGIRLIDPSATQGALGAYDATSGANIAVVTYDLTLDNTVTPSQGLVNTASLTNYASTPGGTDFLAAPLTDPATVTVATPTIAKTLVGTSLNSSSNSNTQAVIGEKATYTVTVTVPQGTSPSAVIADTLANGLAFIQLDSVTSNSGSLTSSKGAFSNTSLFNPTILDAGAAHRLSFDFGTLTDSDNNPATPETLTITYEAVVLDVGGNIAGTKLTNSADFAWKDAGNTSHQTAPVSAQNVTVIEPKPTVTKVADKTTPQAIDVVTYTITIDNSAAGSTDAYHLALSDPLPVGETLVAGSFIVVSDTSGSTPTLVEGSTLTASFADFAFGGKTVLTYQVKINQADQPGQSLTNTADVQWTSLPVLTAVTPNNANSVPRGGPNSGIVGDTVHTYETTGSATIKIPVGLTKSLVTTSEGSTAGNNLTVGEIARYRLTVALPTSTSPNFQILDKLPAGLTFLNDGTATLAFVSGSAGGAYVAGTSPDGIYASNAALQNAGYYASSLGTPTQAVPAGLITGGTGPGGTFKDGDDPLFSLGSLTNTQNDGTAQYVVLDFNAVLDNSVAGNNKAGNTRSNVFDVKVNGSQVGLDSNGVTVTVIEPKITNLTKTVSNGAHDAGDVVTYTVTYSNTGTATAYNVKLSDTLPASLTLDTTLSNIVVTTTGTGVTKTATGNDLSVLIDQLGGGASVTVTYQATLIASVAAGQSITNAATLTYASLPGTNSTASNPTGSTSGASGTDGGGRDGSGTNALDTYTGATSVAFTVPAPTVDKHLVAGNVPGLALPDVTIGETVTYDIVVTLPEGVTKSLSVTDAMPAGLLYQGFTVLTSAAASNGYLIADYAGGALSATHSVVGGNDIFTLGDTSDASDNITNNDSFVIQVTALVTNVGTNVSGKTLQNTSSLTYTNGTTNNPTTVNGPTKPTVTVVEPKLNLVKTPTTGITNLQAGSVVGYSLNLSNTGTSAAYDTTLTDAASADLQITGIASVTGVAGVTAANFAIQPGGTGITTTTPFTVAVGETLVVTYSAVVRPTVTPGESLTNNASTAGTSTPGPNPNERTTTSGDSKTATAATTFQLVKSVVGATTYAIGADVTYDLTLALIDGTTPGVVVTDALPAGMVFVPGSVTVTPAGGMTTGYVSEAASFGISGQNMTFALGDIVNPSGPSTVTIRYTARVADVIGNQAGDQPDNFATATTTAPGIAPSTGEAKIRLVEPNLTVVKTLVTPGKDATDPVVYDITITNASGANVSTAYDVAVSDALDAALQLLSPSTDVTIQNNPGYVNIASNSSTGGQVSLTLNQLNAGDSVTLRITAAVKPTAQPATTINNHVDVVYTSLPGTVPGERTGSGGVDDYTASADASAFTLFGNTLSGKVFYDPNDNGVFDGSDTGITGASVTLTGFDFLGNAVRTTDQTDGNGNYSFTNLRPSDATGYTITETQPAGYLDGKDARPASFTGTVAAGSSTGVQGNDVVSGVVIGRGSNLVGANYTFGEVLPSSISGTAYRDDNDNGNIDAGEPHLASVPVTLTGHDSQGNPVSITIPTDSNGNYSFANLEPSDSAGYTITLGATPGLLDGIDTIGPVGGTTGLNSFTIVLPQNTDAPANNFGKLLPSSLAGVVYVDGNDNGTQDAGEAGIAGVSVTLTGTDDHGIIVPLTATTDNSGHYVFTALRPGTYTVTETQPTQYADGKDAVGTQGGTLGSDVLGNVPLSSGIDATAYDFGERPASLSGKVFVDHNADGNINASDSGLGGVTLTLLDSNCVVVGTTTTLADGTYSFGNLPAGNYRVVETQPNGYGSSTLNVLDVTVPTTGLSNVNFGETLGSLAGTVYHDRDASGSLTGGDTGLGGVLVTLTGTDANGASVTRTTTTAPDGSYSFADLLGGNYAVSESQPAGYTSATNTAGTSNGTVTFDVISDVALGAAVDATSYDYGEVIPTPPGTTFVTGTVYVDANRDGTLQGGETGIGVVALALLDANNNVVGTTTTNANGSYAFTGIAPGNYAIRETQPLAYGSSTPNSLSVTVPIAGLTGQNFGETTSTLAGTVYVDTNNNGVQDGGETGIGGVAVTLTGTDVYGAPFSKTLTTNPDGTYSFQGLLTGTYTATETQPTQYADGKDRVGTAGGTLGDDVLSNVAITGGIDATHYDFGERLASLSGTVFVDRNADGSINGTDAGLGGVTLTLIDANGKTVGTTTTNPDGTYAFADLLAGSYQVVETQPIGYGSSTPNVLNVAVPTTGLNNVNYGETLSSLAGTVYLDSNTSGGLDAGEPGLGGVLLTLTGTDANGQSVSATTTTAPDGSYSFTGLLAGNYTLTETQPAGYGEGADAIGTGGGVTSTIDVISNVGVGPGTALTGYLFGEVAPTTPPGTTFLTGTVYHDANKDGVLQGGESGLGGVTLQLLDSGNNVIATTTTNPDGTYSFTGFVPGSYTVHEVQPAGYGSSTTNDLAVTVPSTGLTGQNFGETLGSLSGLVYLDRDQSGTLTAGDTPLGGVTVQLFDGNGFVTSTTTAADGTYHFDNLPAGTYSVREIQPAAYNEGGNNLGTLSGTATTDLFSSVVLDATSAASFNGTDYDFGEVGTTLSGLVFVDHNRDGLTNGPDAGLGGVTVQLYDANNNLVGTTTTLPDGTYSFKNLPAGDYRVVEVQPNGYGTSTPTVENVTLPTAGLSGIDFGDTLSTLAGTVYVDRDGTKSLTGADLRLGGVTVTLTGTDANGRGVTATATTLADGTYSFADLLAGNYTVTETQPAPWNDGTDTLGSVGGVLAPNTTSSIGLGQGTDGVGYDFGELGATISGYAYYDKNRDAIYEPTETPLPNTTITLRDSTGTVVAVQLTDAAGFYSFANLPAGDYSIAETQPTGYGSSTPNTLDKTLPLSGLTNQDFGDTKTSLAGHVYLDQNKNGTLDRTEPGLAGVTLTLTGTDANERLVSATTTTGADGSYSFDELLAGMYSIRETQPVRYNEGKDTLGTSGGDGTVIDLFSNIALLPDMPGTHYDFGEVGAKLSGKVFVDGNLEGIAQPAEPGLGGVTIDLFEGNHRVASTTTKTDGTYVFDNLPIGPYQVVEHQPIAYGSSTPNALNVNVPLTGTKDVNFGETTGSISGSVWIDRNNDGVRQDGETGIPNTLVTLTGTDVLGHAVSESVETDAQGDYSFTDLLRGNYQIARAGLPAGYVAGTNHLGSLGGSVTVDVFLTALPAGTSGLEYDFAAVPVPASDPTLVTPRSPVALAPSTNTLVPVTNLVDPLFGLGPSPTTQTNTKPGTIREAGIEEGAARLGGYVFHDRNSNDVADENEEGIAGVSVTLNGTTAKGRTITRTTTTDDGGAYTFNELPPGLYSVARSTPEGFLDGGYLLGNVNGAATGEISIDSFSRIGLQDGSTGLDYNFAEVQTAALRGVVWVASEEMEDEPGMFTVVGKSGVTVRLTGKDDRGRAVSRTVKSDDDGQYTFDGLYPGNYNVEVATPRGFRSVEARPGDKGGTPQAKKQIDKIRLSPGDKGAEYEFFYEGTGQVTGRVSVRPGAINRTVGMGGAVVVLTGTDRDGRTFERTTTTDAKGRYLFYALPPGTYRVEVMTEPDKEKWAKSPAQVNRKPAGVAVADAVAVEGIALGADSRATDLDFTASGGAE
jgi:uncharacterized repeat protein (TIGR01451 family)/fimbrial isopeptide formation D2 family protein